MLHWRSGDGALEADSGGTVILGYRFGPDLRLRFPGGLDRVEACGRGAAASGSSHRGHAAQTGLDRDAVARGAPPPVTGEDGRRAAAVPGHPCHGTAGPHPALRGPLGGVRLP
jgi:hypothetical protein